MPENEKPPAMWVDIYFVCMKNPEIENFVKNNAIEFAKKKMSITYLVVDSDVKIQAIFTLTHKALELRNDVLSGTARKKVQRFAQLDKSTDSFVVSAFLVAQFGKNEAIEHIGISVDELMDMTFKILLGVQHDIGGSVVYLECEDKKKFLLLNKIAVWDVIASCDITGSSDSSIKNVVANDLSEILSYAEIKQIFVNDKTAEKYYNKYIKNTIDREALYLPSTSPANAAWSVEKLISVWNIIKDN